MGKTIQKMIAVNDSVFKINLTGKTSEFGYYNFIVQAAEIYDLNQVSGEYGMQVDWVQNIKSDTTLRMSICWGNRMANVPFLHTAP